MFVKLQIDLKNISIMGQFATITPVLVSWSVDQQANAAGVAQALDNEVNTVIPAISGYVADSVTVSDYQVILNGMTLSGVAIIGYLVQS